MDLSLNYPISISSVLFARIVLGLILLMAGLSKLIAWKEFTTAVIGYEILPYTFAKFFGYVLPWVELSIAGLLLCGMFASIASLGALFLLVSFCIAIGINLLRGRELDCHCFGQLSEEKIGPWALIRNLLLSLLAMVIILFNGPFFTLRSERNAVSYLGKDAIPVVMIGIATFLFFLLFQQASTMRRTVTITSTKSKFNRRAKSMNKK